MMQFGKAKQLQKFQPIKVRLDGKNVNTAETAMFVRMNLDSQLIFNFHVDQFRSKVARSLGCLNRVKRLSQDDRSNGCDSVWINCSAASKVRLQQQHNRQLMASWW